MCVFIIIIILFCLIYYSYIINIIGQKRELECSPHELECVRYELKCGTRGTLIHALNGLKKANICKKKMDF